jgi:hypothetical protein
MKFVISIAAVIGFLMAWAVYDIDVKRHPAAPPPAGCRAPTQEGDLAIITVALRGGELIAECSYATTRVAKPKTKGG